ncbi:acyltransferase family protein [uncultured Anaerococcus sp.]|uniref:acyltransferase family protein n=1 Tax=uncultured Anaerococcus sp. TaxID=293428 RepID=UPI00280B2D93|nr:acyltransferase family protein [uncultured Anaerococcus sp.]MDU5150026.1 acyltransferase family protein [Anaerococcus prevotii]
MRIKGLDNLRVFGISLVVIYHIFKEFLPAGFLGVNIMFVLSGFLVSFHLLNEVYKTDDIDLKTYYKKRYRRIYPGVLFMVFVVSLMAIFVNRDYTVHYFDQVLAALSFTSNYYEILTGGSYESQFISHLFLHTWFLAIEVHFYLLWPLLIKFIYKRSEKANNVKKTFSNRFFAISLILYLITFALTIILTGLGKNISFIYFADFTRLSSFFLGAIVACFVKRFGFRKIPYKTVSAIAFSLITILAFFLSYEMKTTYILGFFITDLATVMLILAAYSDENARDPLAVKKISPYTYSIYLMHWPVYVITSSLMNKPSALVLTIIITAVLVMINHHIFEPLFRGEEIGYLSFKKNPADIARIITLVAVIIISFVTSISLTIASDDMVSLEKQIWLSSINQDIGKIKKDKEKLDKFIIENDNPNEIITEEAITTTILADSVLLGNREYIEETIDGTYVDAEGSRLLEKAPEIIKEIDNEGNLGDIVAIALGTNAVEDPEESLEKIVKNLPKGKKLIFISCYDSRYDQPHRVSQAMKKVSEKYKFITYMPWEELAMDHPEFYQGTDGVHFYGNIEAYDAYNDLLQKAILEANKKEGK